jgi:hypothetical protein
VNENQKFPSVDMGASAKWDPAKYVILHKITINFFISAHYKTLNLFRIFLHSSSFTANTQCVSLNLLFLFCKIFFFKSAYPFCGG